MDPFQSCLRDPLFGNGVQFFGLIHFHATPPPRENVRPIRGKRAGPRIVAAGRILDGRRPIIAGATAINNAREGMDAVMAAKREGLDFIKVYNLISRDAYFAIAAEAKKQGLAFVGHVPESVSAADASDAGQKSFEIWTDRWI